MKPQSRIFITGISSFGIALIIAFIAFAIFRDINAEHAKSIYFSGIRQKTQALQLLSMSFEEGAGRSDIRLAKGILKELEASFDKITTQWEPREEKLFRQIQQHHRELQSLINELFDPPHAKAGTQRERRAMIASQISMKIQFISDDTNRLIDIGRARIFAAQERAGVTILILIILLAVTTGGIYMLSGRALVRAEKNLRRSRDELDVRVQERTKELTHAYETLRKETEERKKAEDKLRQVHKMEAIGTLAGGIAHDFNNMLAVIIGNVELALEDVPQAYNEARHSLESTMKAAKRCRDLVKQILTFSKKDTRDLKNQPVTPLIEESLKFLRASLPSNIEMNLNLRAKSDTALVNETQFQQVLMNLCTNAAHAMKENGGVLEISLEETLHLEHPSSSQPQKYLKMTVHDTGTGMDAELKNKAFDPFFTTKGPGEGTGMGLSVVYGIVEAHNGFITVKSEPGQGSSFSVFFPQFDGARPEAGQSVPAVIGGQERILFVDDEAEIVDMATAMLQKLGYTVESFTDAQAAFEAFSKAPADFDLVITDEMMPKMTGVTLAKKLKAIRPDVPILLCTGYSQTVSAEEAKAQGIEGFVMKPVPKMEMAGAVRKILNKRGSRQGL